jgi:chromatin segregation and condensation protein Rec8/ScpA/Scc1 (kleisin family)
MAATLIRIKAQMLLPRHEGDEEQDPRAELVRRLLEYEQIREISIRLQASEAERARRFGKGFVPTRPRPTMSDTPLETTWDEVLEAAMRVALPDDAQRLHSVTTRPVAMEDKVALILSTLTEHQRIEFHRLLAGFEREGGKAHAVMTFLAGLELTRRHELYLRQVMPFSDLWIYRRAEGDEVPPVEGRSAPDEEPETFRGLKRRPDFMKPEELEPEDDPLLALLKRVDERVAATAAATAGASEPFANGASHAEPVAMLEVPTGPRLVVDDEAAAEADASDEGSEDAPTDSSDSDQETK